MRTDFTARAIRAVHLPCDAVILFQVPLEGLPRSYSRPSLCGVHESRLMAKEATASEGEAGGMVGDPDGSENYLESGNIVAGNVKLFRDLLRTVHRGLKVAHQ